MTRNRVTLPAMNESKRFWSKVLRGDPEECWMWQGAKTYNGYGRFNFEGRLTGAHQASFLLSGRTIESGKCVLHKCDTRGCVNPHHLFLGTRAENMQDMVAKGRHRHQVYPEGRPHGSRNGRAKLTDAQVLEIRAQLAAGSTQQALADKFGVVQTSISRIALGQGWQIREVSK